MPNIEILFYHQINVKKLVKYKKILIERNESGKGEKNKKKKNKVR